MTGTTERSRTEWLELLRTNGSFEEPEAWVEYAAAHNFRPVAAIAVPRCPDCGNAPQGILGQFVYYSTRMVLRSCPRCALVWADHRVPPDVVQSHFESAYKDEQYFLRQREPVFAQLAARVAAAAPRGGRVLDIGGAKGHLLAAVRRLRPDLTCVINDLSDVACAHARSAYGFEAFQGPSASLPADVGCFDVVVLSDVLYYEADLAAFWTRLDTLLIDGGTVLIRGPNKLTLVRVAQALRRLVVSTKRRALDAEVPFFNPEQLYLFPRRYLKRRLASIGCRRIRWMPADILAPAEGSPVPRRLWAWAARAVAAITASRVVLTPSVITEGSR